MAGRQAGWKERSPRLPPANAPLGQPTRATRCRAGTRQTDRRQTRAQRDRAREKHTWPVNQVARDTRASLLWPAASRAAPPPERCAWLWAWPGCMRGCKPTPYRANHSHRDTPTKAHAQLLTAKPEPASLSVSQASQAVSQPRPALPPHLSLSPAPRRRPRPPQATSNTRGQPPAAASSSDRQSVPFQALSRFSPSRFSCCLLVPTPHTLRIPLLPNSFPSSILFLILPRTAITRPRSSYPEPLFQLLATLTGHRATSLASLFLSSSPAAIP